MGSGNKSFHVESSWRWNEKIEGVVTIDVGACSKTGWMCFCEGTNYDPDEL